MIKNLYIAEVKDNDDANAQDGLTPKQDRVQIYIKSKMFGYETIHLPWARPFHLSTGGSSSSGKSNIPEKDSLIWVFFENEELMIHPFYIADASLENFNISKKFEESVKSKITGMASTYPNIKFTCYKNGICTFVSSDPSNPEIGYYHPSGTYTFVNKDGEMLTDTKAKKYRIQNNFGYIELKDTTGQVDINGNLTIDV